MLHLYIGDGKGKTTAAMGLALRMAGRGGRVLIAQFLKGADSGERAVLAGLPNVTVLEVPEQVKFSFLLTDGEREEERDRCRTMLEAVRARLGEVDLVVLDELCDGVNCGLVCLEEVLHLLDSARCEVVVTGRDPKPELEERADYITYFQKVRHPYDSGTAARSGIEF